MLHVGDSAPDFTAIDCQGGPVSLAALRGRRVVLFFFPKAFTLGCTLENRYFRDNHERLRELGAELVGVSVDTVQRQCEFAEAEDIHFTLIGDESREISRAYDVLWPVLNVDRRMTFIISPEGRVEAVIHHEMRVYRHMDDVLAYLQAHPLPTAAGGGGGGATPS
jgi:thioredoxin-dependent peroxiredoxin